MGKESEASYPHLSLVTAGPLSTYGMECPEAAVRISFPFIYSFSADYAAHPSDPGRAPRVQQRGRG